MEPSKTIHYTHIDRFSSRRPFSLMIKPVGGLCNLDCKYCYYSCVGSSHGKMSLEILEEAISKLIQNNDSQEISILWHGGEPMLAGLAFFEKAMEFEEFFTKRKGTGQKVSNSIQTNGTMIDDNWASFFRQNGFFVGLSLDGPKEIHDKFRQDKKGFHSFDKVLRGLEVLKNERVEFNTLSTVNSASVGKGAVVYDFFKGIGSEYMQFLPVVAPNDPWGVKANDYGRFMIDVFDEWWKNQDAGKYYVQLIDVALANYMGQESGLCQFSPVCGDVPVVESDGKVYACDHFVNRQNFLGSIYDSADSLFYSGRLPVFGIDKFSRLPKRCKFCNHLNLCYGGCPEHRIIPSENDFEINFLCEGYRDFFDHIKPYLKQMSNHINNL